MIRKLITALLEGFCILTALEAQAQYTFSSLAPYTQDFNGLTPNTAVFNAGTFSGAPGIILGYQGGSSFLGFTGNVTANDGTATTTAAYNFGTTGAADRALGGIAGGFASNSGIGYICIRLLNNSGATIKNLDVRYAIEQWYNSSKTTSANFDVAYRKYASSAAFNANDIATETGWTATPDLNLAAPATGGILGKVDGNSTTYRRTAQKRLLDVNMAIGEEVIIRLKYVFNPDTNGNGISVDDIAIYPETNVLYSKTTGNLDDTGNWGQNTDGSNPPASVSFAAPNYTYFVQGTTTDDRLSGALNVSGTNSRVVVGTDATPATLQITAGDAMTAAVDVGKNSTLKIADRLVSGTNVNLTLGSLATGSTVEYNAAGTQNLVGSSTSPVTPVNITYANLILGGSGSAKFLKSHVTVSGTLTLAQTASLANYNLTLLREATLSRTPGGQVQTTGTGSLRLTVPGGAATSLLFPLALTSGTADYLPITITAGSTDKDETYRAQVVSGVYTTYATTGTTPATYANSVGATAAPALDNLNATWYIGHETATPVAATVKVGWVESAAREGTHFAQRRSVAYLDHYTGSTNTWDANPADRGATSSGGLWYVTRTNVSSFSPFAVTVNNGGPLPVQLTRFEASRSASTVTCSWATASELNNSYFVVERSLDGETFGTLGQVAGQGSSVVAHTYTFVDANPAAGVAFYRLRQVDTDGTASFSPVVVVASGAVGPSPVVALPNPSTGRFELRLVSEQAGMVQATVLNVQGQQVMQASYPVPGGAAALPLDLSTQPVGVYLVRLQGPSSTATLRLLKQ